MKTTITINGTHCHACKALIEDVCSDIPGVTACTVDFTTGVTKVEHEESINWQTVKQEIEAVGAYEVKIQ